MSATRFEFNEYGEIINREPVVEVASDSDVEETPTTERVLGDIEDYLAKHNLSAEALISQAEYGAKMRELFDWLRSIVPQEDENLQNLTVGVDHSTEEDQELADDYLTRQKLAALREIFKQMLAIEKSLSAERQTYTCIGCNQVIPESAGFCAYCGQQQKAVENDRPTICKKCGKTNPGNSSYCAYCGAKSGVENLKENKV